jgi:hypothetical protein
MPLNWIWDLIHNSNFSVEKTLEYVDVWIFESEHDPNEW